MKNFMKTIQIEDPRQQHKVKHTLQDVIGLVLIATLAGADTLVVIEFFGECHAETLAKYLSFPNGMPSHDTIGRVLQLVDPTYLYELQTNWNQFFIQTNDSTINKIINIDGKTMRGHASKDQKANHILSAWSKADGVCFGQVTVNDESNEITAIPKLLDTLHLEKMIVTLDAMGTQTDIASDIIQKKADYVLAIKENHKLLYQDITDYFCHAPFLEEMKQLKKGYVCTIEKSHSQIEKRFYYQTDDISWLEAKVKWKDVKSIGMVEKIMEKDDEIRVERRYYISSLQTDAALFAKNLFRIYGIICTKRIFSMIHNYTSNVSRDQFELIREDLENARKRTRPRTVDLYEVFCGVLYVLTTGCQWRNLPSDFPNWQTVYFYYQIWRKVDENGISLLETVHKKIG